MEGNNMLSLPFVKLLDVLRRCTKCHVELLEKLLLEFLLNSFVGVSLLLQKRDVA